MDIRDIGHAPGRRYPSLSYQAQSEAARPQPQAQGRHAAISGVLRDAFAFLETDLGFKGESLGWAPGGACVVRYTSPTVTLWVVESFGNVAWSLAPAAGETSMADALDVDFLLEQHGVPAPPQVASEDPSEAALVISTLAQLANRHLKPELGGTLTEAYASAVRAAAAAVPLPTRALAAIREAYGWLADDGFAELEANADAEQALVVFKDASSDVAVSVIVNWDVGATAVSVSRGGDCEPDVVEGALARIDAALLCTELAAGANAARQRLAGWTG
jgi:hypothetical protein